MPQLYTRETDAGASELWKVRMSVDGMIWWPEWTGHATNSLEATQKAMADFKAKNGLLALTVHEVFQLGA